MKKPIIILFTTVFFCIMIPIIISIIFYRGDISDNTVAKSIDSKSSITSNADSNKLKNIKNYKSNLDYKEISVYNTKLDRVENMDLESYLYGVVSMEMPSSFCEESLKAQAVAARTYVVYKIENKIKENHKGADICTDYRHCQAYASYEDLEKQKGKEWINKYYPIIKKAVDDTRGQILVYKEKAIQPLYFSTCGGFTEDSEDVFMTDYPYLKSVKSPYESDSPKYYTESVVDKQTFINTLMGNYNNISLNKDTISSDVKILDRTDAGTVKVIKLGNYKLTGKDIRSLFKLNSANFNLVFNQDDTITFKVKGYGHGVGMSQWGAEGMARHGYKYNQILGHYYKDTNIEKIYK